MYLTLKKNSGLYFQKTIKNLLSKQKILTGAKLANQREYIPQVKYLLALYVNELLLSLRDLNGSSLIGSP